ncbi:MAG: hypothetical protein M1554_03265 [Patescibacteria group bacterium]|jgi:hypothetical protein|nr:hypothetical protein [Patescibacteria group bacterium]
MKINRSNKGFSAIESVLIVVIVLAIAGVGYYVYKANKSSLSPNNTPNVSTVATYQSPPVSTPVAPASISSASQLNSVYQELNQTAIGANSTDSNQLLVQANGF